MNAKTVALVALALIMGMVIVQNTDVVSMQFLFWQVSMSRIVLLLLAVVVGFLMGILVGKGKRRGPGA